MLTGIDHIAIVVNDLDDASHQFANAGFTISPGGSHPVGTYNTLVSFADGTYLELIAIEQPELAIDHPWFQKMDGKQGFAAFAMAAQPLDYELQRLSGLGLIPVRQRDGARRRPDGQLVRWKSSDLMSEPLMFLPFLIEDVTDRSIRVPSGAATVHANGVKGISGLTIITDDLDTMKQRYGALFGAPVVALDHGFDGIEQSWRYFAGTHWIDLIQPASADTALAKHRATYGPGIVQLALNSDAKREFPPQRIDVPGFPDLHLLTTN